MPSGVRVTIALIVVVFVGIGLYYASLENPKTKPATSGDEGLVRPETNDDKVPPLAPPKDPFASKPTQSEETKPAPKKPEPVTVTDTPELSTPTTIETGVTDTPNKTTLADSGDSIPVPVVETEESDSTKTEAPQRVSQGIAANGSSVRLIADPYMSGVDAKAIVQDFQETGTMKGPPGTAWVKLASWITLVNNDDSPLWITGKRDGENWLLVRDDSEGTVDLRDHVLAANERKDQLHDGPLVVFVLDDTAMPQMRELTSSNVGHYFALIVDREVVAVQFIQIASEARVTIVPKCDRENAKWIAARIRGDEVERPSAKSDDSDSDTASTNSSAADGSGTTVQKTPPENYSTWVVSDGDTFASIAQDWFGNASKWTLIAKANPRVDPDRLRLGQKLRLPPKNTEMSVEVTEGVHVVSSGETLSDIAQAYYGKAKYWKNIYDANRALIGNNPEVLVVGTKLTMPKIDT